jgi:hypothetical protein
VCGATADTGIVEHVGNDPAMPLGDSAEFADLVLSGLFLGGTADIERNMLWHDRIIGHGAAWDPQNASLKPTENGRSEHAFSEGVLGQPRQASTLNRLAA